MSRSKGVGGCFQIDRSRNRGRSTTYPLLIIVLLALHLLVELIAQTAQTGLRIADLSPANQTEGNGSPRYGSQDEPVAAVPGRSPAALSGMSVGPVQSNEGAELAGQRELDGHEQRGPRGHGGQDAETVAEPRSRVAGRLLSVLEAPMDGA